MYVQSIFCTSGVFVCLLCVLAQSSGENVPVFPPRFLCVCIDSSLILLLLPNACLNLCIRSLLTQKHLFVLLQFTLMYYTGNDASSDRDPWSNYRWTDSGSEDDRILSPYVDLTCRYLHESA